jgi:benzoate 4-monooxygenase
VHPKFCHETNIIKADFAFGKSFDFVNSGKDSQSLIRTVDNRGEALNALVALPIFIRPWMKYYPFDKFWSDGLLAKSSLERLGRASFQQRKADAQEHNDLLSLLFSAKDPDTGALIVDAEIIEEAISFIAGGNDTTSSTMTHFVDLVSRNTDIQRQLQRRIDGSFPGDIEDDWVVPDSIVKNLPLLNATLKEAMRLRPTGSTGLERIVPPGEEIAGNSFSGGVSPMSFSKPVQFGKRVTFLQPQLCMIRQSLK